MNTQSARFCIQQKTSSLFQFVLKQEWQQKAPWWSVFSFCYFQCVICKGRGPLTAVGHNSLQYTTQERPLVSFIPSLEELWPKYFSNVTALTIKHSRNNVGHTRKKNSLLQSHLLGINSLPLSPKCLDKHQYLRYSLIPIWAEIRTLLGLHWVNSYFNHLYLQAERMKIHSYLGLISYDQPKEKIFSLRTGQSTYLSSHYLSQLTDKYKQVLSSIQRQILQESEHQSASV